MEGRVDFFSSLLPDESFSPPPSAQEEEGIKGVGGIREKQNWRRVKRFRIS
jgi:hypothetical protein